MKDSFGRDINYLRISLTKRCNLNCSYCGREKKDFSQELTSKEIFNIVKAFAQLGIEKVRLTGGEPLLREDISEIVEGIKNINGIKSVNITTNAILLKSKIKDLKNAGIDGINISIDTLNPENYFLMTGTNKLNDVLEGFYSALEQGINSVKVNSVLVKGKNDHEAEDLIMLAKNTFADVRFIELMPFSKQGEDKSLIVTTAELLERFPYLVKCEQAEQGAAEYYTAPMFSGRVGFISPRSRKFCRSCNRVRLLADGKLKLCLGNDLSFDIRPFVFQEDRLKKEIENAIINKPEGHHFEQGEFFRGLNLIGG